MNLKNILTADQYATIMRRSNARAWWMVTCNYAITIALFTMMAIWPNPLTILAGIVLLGGRQLGFGVIVHECGHGTFFESRRLNDFVGQWLAAAPTFNNMKAYSRGHLAHHKLAGTRDDPDLPNYQDYPITRSRLRRKIWRDASGQTGWKQTRGLIGALAKFLRPSSPDQPDQNLDRGQAFNGAMADTSEQTREQKLALARGLIYNLGMLGLFTWLGAAWLYLVWWAAQLTSNRLVSRLRQVAEHAAVPDLYHSDPRMNTRTIPAGWLDRLVFCPMGVNYHLEHHIQASIPVYNLPKLHRMLQDNGSYDGVHFPPSYLTMLREVTLPG